MSDVSGVVGVSDPDAERAAVRIRAMGPLPQVDLRFDPADRALLARIGDAFTVAPPTTPNTVATAADGQGHILWLGPDEWLIVGPEDGAADIAPAVERVIREATGDGFATAVDVSANRIGFEISGADGPRLLAFGCAIDLDPRVFGPGRCAQTLVARAGAIVWHVGDDPVPSYRLLVRPSFATYVETWLRDAEAGLG